jgi:CCR4-NOT transcription complex subunit 1
MQVLQVNAMQVSSQDLTEELKRVKDAAIRVNPRLMSAGASDQSQAETYSSDVEEEANSYFQRIYIGQLSIDNVVEMLQRFNMAPPDLYAPYSTHVKSICFCLVGMSSDCEDF